MKTKKNELRIGNLIYYHIYDMGKEKILTCEYELSDDEDDIEFIPLTEDWLIRLGFYRFDPVKYPERWILKRYNADYTIYLHPNMITFEMDDSNWAKEIPYVHKLQNLWFELEDEELTYDGNLEELESEWKEL